MRIDELAAVLHPGKRALLNMLNDCTIGVALVVSLLHCPSPLQCLGKRTDILGEVGLRQIMKMYWTEYELIVYRIK